MAYYRLITAALAAASLTVVAACGDSEDQAEAPSSPVEQAEEALEEAVEVVEDAADEAAEAAEDVVDEAADALEDAAEAVEEAAEDAAEAVDEVAEDAAEAVEEVVEDAVEAVAPTGPLADAVAALGGDAEVGARLWRQCQACHVIDQEQNRVGPHLVGLIGRPAGLIEGFRYSPANADSGVVWTPDVLVEYLQDPRAYLPGTTMSFRGLRSADEAADLIAYLLREGGLYQGE